MATLNFCRVATCFFAAQNPAVDEKSHVNSVNLIMKTQSWQAQSRPSSTMMHSSSHPRSVENVAVRVPGTAGRDRFPIGKDGRQ